MYSSRKEDSVAVIAIQQIRRMRGGAQSHLMLASDGNLYVVKFRNNPQHIRVLANELLATRLGAAIGLTVPYSDVIEAVSYTHLDVYKRQIRSSP